jgi:hypothetical protein
MKRMTVTIEDDQLAALRAEADALGTTVSAVVRAAAETLRDPD